MEAEGVVDTEAEPVCLVLADNSGDVEADEVHDVPIVDVTLLEGDAP